MALTFINFFSLLQTTSALYTFEFFFNFLNQFNIFHRIERLNGLLPFLLLLFIMIYLVLRMLGQLWLVRLVLRWVVCIAACFCKVITWGHCGISSSIVPTRKFKPGYTEPHIIFVKKTTAVSLSQYYRSSGVRLTQVEKDQGWVETVSNGSVLKFKVWQEDGVLQGLKHRKGDKKKTWEVIRDSALHTYDITENPNYSDAFGKIHKRMSSSGNRSHN